MGLGPVSLGNRRRLAIFAGVFIALVGAFHLLQTRHVIRQQPIPVPNSEGEQELKQESSEKGLGKDPETSSKDPCALLEGMEDVFVIIRTGTNEIENKLPPLLNTTLPCFKHYGIWSDMEEEFAGHHIGNALDEIEPELLQNHPDFEYYRHLQEHGKKTVASEEVASWQDAPNTGFGRDTPAWKLDKWKFLPVAKKAYLKNPTVKWYVFIEGDTYVLWNSMLAWLSKVDASRPYYIGRQMNIGDAVFAYGGAGIIISNAAMEKLVERYTMNTHAYNELTINQWAGDFILSQAMTDVGIKLSPVWPTLEGEMPAALNMAAKSTQSRHLWCYNAATYHHMTPEDIYSYYEFDREWYSKDQGFPRHGDLFRLMVFPRIKEQLTEWDNLSADVKMENSTFAECRESCENETDCLQFSLSGNTCKTSNDVRLGQEESVEQKSGGRIDSGWILGRIGAFMETMEASCEGEGWVMP
ncbi:hypothetical protein F4808DRAFT_418756 [Astrocystis sublimbata]|nr:hypothetical protein F4808DRAFT_418756 [Astrocystis sublimbata]